MNDPDEGRDLTPEEKAEINRDLLDAILYGKDNTEKKEEE